MKRDKTLSVERDPDGCEDVHRFLDSSKRLASMLRGLEGADSGGEELGIPRKEACVRTHVQEWAQSTWIFESDINVPKKAPCRHGP